MELRLAISRSGSSLGQGVGRCLRELAARAQVLHVDGSDVHRVSTIFHTRRVHALMVVDRSFSSHHSSVTFANL